MIGNLGGLRLRLTLLYLGIGLAFLLLVGAGSYGLLRGYYQTSTDLALQHRLVEELRLLGATPPPELAAADLAWYASRGRVAPPLPTARPLETEDDEDGSNDSDDRNEAEDDRHGDDERRDNDERSGGEDSAEDDEHDRFGSDDGSGNGTEGAEPPHDEALEESYDSELAVVFSRHLASDGQPLDVLGASQGHPALPSPASTDAVTGALAHGSDWRTVRTSDGTGVRLMTFHLASGDSAGTAFLQLGRPLDDQERVLRRLLVVLLGLGSLSAVLLGAGGWWLAGRSLQPAERAWRQQQAFVANASHELRTPLTLIRASAEVLRRSLPPAGDHRPLIDDILVECDHTSRLVSDLLLLSRIDSGQLALSREPVALDGLFSDLARQFGRVAESKGVSFSAIVDEGPAGVPVVVLADRIRLRQVLLALLDNSLRHTPPRGGIRLEARAEAGRAHGAQEGRTSDRAPGHAAAGATVVVADTGEGIAPEDLPNVFDRFFRAGQRSTGGADGGAGLGLAVAKALVEAQGGRIAIESERGTGTRVEVWLPG